MSTEIKIGDTVLRVGPTVGACVHGREYTVTDAHPGEIKIAGPPGWWSVSKFEPVRIPDATAAPLDPKSVHVGDTVTVRFKETGDEIVTKAYQPDDITRSGEWVYLLGFPLHRPDGTFGLAFSNFEILAIEPTPEPEPAWKPGTTGTATLNSLVSGASSLGMRAMRVIDEDGTGSFVFENSKWIRDDATTWSVSDFVPDEPRPLPTRDDLARIMHDDYLPNGSPRLGRTAREELAAAVLRFLRGESR